MEIIYQIFYFEFFFLTRPRAALWKVWQLPQFFCVICLYTVSNQAHVFCSRKRMCLSQSSHSCASNNQIVCHILFGCISYFVGLPCGTLRAHLRPCLQVKHPTKTNPDSWPSCLLKRIQPCGIIHKLWQWFYHCHCVDRVL